MKNLICLLWLFSATLLAQLNYPSTRRVDAPALPGSSIKDPFQWLEEEKSPEVIAWTKAQAELTQKHLESLPGRREIGSALEKLMDVPLQSTPAVYGGKLFYSIRRPGAERPIWFVEDKKGRRTLVDLNSLNASLDWSFPSPTGRYFAYGLSKQGSEDSVLHVVEVDTGKQIGPTVSRTGFQSVAWLPDESGFFYSRFPAPGPDQAENIKRRIHFRNLKNESPDSDPVVWGADRPRGEFPSVEISKDGAILIVTVSRGPSESEIFVRETKSERPFRSLTAGKKAIFRPYPLDGKRLLVLSNYMAPRGKVLLYDLIGSSEPRVVVPERRDVIIKGAALINNELVLNSSKNVASILERFTLDGKALGGVRLPGFGTVTLGRAGQKEGQLFYSYRSFDTANLIFRLRGESQKLWFRGIEEPGVTVSQEWFKSKDGTSVPIFIARSKTWNKNSPAMLSGYGGFNLSMTPFFSNEQIVWMQRGGLIAVPNLRGGGEFGEEWHRAGMLEQKENSFHDMIAAAEHLIAKGLVQRGRLALTGGSNGGLMVAAVVNMRPDLFKVAISMVPLTDMLRYALDNRFGRLWIPEYGDPSKPEHFKFLSRYSPYHNIGDTKAYPAILVTIGEADGRVQTSHGKKYVAALQTATTPTQGTFLLRADLDTGHGAGTPRSKILAETIDRLAFIEAHLK